MCLYVLLDMAWVGLMNNLSQYKVVGITGIIGSGKTFLSELLKHSHKANIIEVDNIRRSMLWHSLSIDSINLRKDIIHQFSIDKYDENYFFDRSSFTQLIFSNVNILQKFNLLCRPYFYKNIKDNILDDVLNCIVWVNLIEDDYLDLIEHLLFIDISQQQWLTYNINNLDFISQRYNMQTDIINKKQLLTQLKISYEVYTNE